MQKSLPHPPFGHTRSGCEPEPAGPLPRAGRGGRGGSVRPSPQNFLWEKVVEDRMREKKLT